MSSYFDSFDREVNVAAHHCRDSDARFLQQVQNLESVMKRHCELLAGDRDTPEEVRKKIMACLHLHSIRFAGQVEGLNEDSKANAQTLCLRRSKLSSEMHRLFHEIAGMRIETRYGRIMDNPEAAIRARDAHAEAKGE